MSRKSLTVMMSVLEGGDGCESAGSLSRSSDRLGEWRRAVNDDDDEERDLGGVDMSVSISVVGEMKRVVRESVDKQRLN